MLRAKVKSDGMPQAKAKTIDKADSIRHGSCKGLSGRR